MDDPLYRLAADDGDRWPTFPGHRFTGARNDADATIRAKLRQAARLIADRLNGLPAEDREEWLTLQYPGGLTAGRALLIDVLDDEAVTPSRTLQRICRELFGATRQRMKRRSTRRDREP